MTRIETVIYRAGDVEMAGALVWNEAVKGARPAVLMAPDWMGVGAAALEMAGKIADTAFCVFVADMYGKNIRPQNHDEAAALSGPVKADIGLMRTRIAAAYSAMHDAARHHGLAGSGPGAAAPSAAIGFCFGGTNVLELARMGADPRIVICIHGELLTPMPARNGTLQSKILILHGSDDPVAPKMQRDAFEAEMSAAGAEWWQAVFGGAVHSFTDPHAHLDKVAMYDEKAARWTHRIVSQTLADELIG